jgi:hypothetical protein
VLACAASTLCAWRMLKRVTVLLRWPLLDVDRRNAASHPAATIRRFSPLAAAFF